MNSPKSHVMTPRRMTPLMLRLGTLAGIIGPILFVLGFTVNGLLRPGYSTTGEMISNLGRGSNAWIQDVNFALCGLLLIAFALRFSQALRPLLGKGGWIASTILLLLSGAGWVNESFFATALPGEKSLGLHGVLHVIGFFDIFFALMIALFIIGWQLRKIPGWRGDGWYSLASSLLTLGLFFVLIAVANQAPQIVGVMNRLLVVATLAWYMVMGWRLLVRERQEMGS